MEKADFKWGINGHNGGYPAYSETKLDQQLAYTQELGMAYYRINCTPKTELEFAYLDKVVDEADKHNLKLFLVIFDTRLHSENISETLYADARAIAQHYAGRIPMYQISNEQDIPALDLVNLKDPIGDKREDYDMVKFKNISDNMAAILKGVRDGDPSAETVVNFSWKHNFFLDMLMENGMMWDSTAIDWYYDLHGGDGDILPTIEHCLAHPQQNFYVAEGNTWEGDYKFTEQEQNDYLMDAFKFFYEYPNEKVKGYMIYQLLDEPDKERGEAHFGLMLNDLKGNIGRKKSAFNGVQKFIASHK